ncbi:MAG: hypothetical protein AABX65_01780 [Nanoarchaeota archaeon]
MAKTQKNKDTKNLVEGRCSIFKNGYYFAFPNYLISCEVTDTGRINFELSELKTEVDIVRFGFPVKIKANLLDKIHQLLQLSSIFNPDNFYTALNRSIDSFYKTMMAQVYYDSIDCREWNVSSLEAFSDKAAKEFKAEFFDFTEENEVRRSFGLAGKVE